MNIKKKFFKISLVISVSTLIILLILSSPIFATKEIEIVGNSVLSVADIKKSLDVKDKNLFSITEKKVFESFKGNPFVKNVSIKKNYPDGLSVNIVERKPSGYVKYTEDTFLYIDDEGYVLNTVNEMDQGLPLVVGLDFKTFVIGQPLVVEDEKTFSIIISLTNLMNKYKMSDEIVRIDLSNLDNIRFTLYNVEFLFGNIENADFKVQKAKQTFEQLPDNTVIKAIVDLETDIINLLT